MRKLDAMLEQIELVSEEQMANLSGGFTFNAVSQDTLVVRSGGGAITAEVWGDAIAVAFHKEVGELLVAITDESGNTVYETTVNTPVQQQLLIPLTGLPSGTYTIAFSNGRGEMRGEFEI